MQNLKKQFDIPKEYIIQKDAVTPKDEVMIDLMNSERGAIGSNLIIVLNRKTSQSKTMSNGKGIGGIYTKKMVVEKIQ